jgi:DNA-binding IclR family transcriptional regulator
VKNPNPVNTAAKLLEVLGLFSSEEPVWRVEHVAAALRVSQSTAYRHVAQLVRAGFLDPVAGGGYVLGPAFVEFDRRIRLSDPLLQAAKTQIARLRKAVGTRASIVLARYYRDRVMCIHIEHATPEAAQVSYERGLPMSPFRGATSKAILASLPDRVLRRLYRTRAPEIATAGMGQDWKTFSAALRDIRDAGYAITRSEVARGRVGVAAPILADGAVLGSLSVVVAARGLTEQETADFAESVVLAAGRISTALARSHLGPPRLVARRATNRARSSRRRTTTTPAK